MPIDISSPRLEIPKDTGTPPLIKIKQDPQTNGEVPGATVSASVPLTEFNRPKKPFFTFPHIDPYYQILGITVLLLIFAIVVGTIVWRKSKKQKN